MKKYYIYKIIDSNGLEYYQIRIKTYFLWFFYEHSWHYDTMYHDAIGPVTSSSKLGTVVWKTSSITEAEDKIKSFKNAEKYFTKHELVGEY